MSSHPQSCVDLDVATTEGGRNAMLVTSGLLHGAVGDGRACFWVKASEGATYSIVWPAGSRALLDPLRVVARDGTELAREGDGGLVFGGSMDLRREGCRPGSRIWLASSVERAS